MSLLYYTTCVSTVYTNVINPMLCLTYSRVQDTVSHSKSCSTTSGQESPPTHSPQSSTNKIKKSSNSPPTNRSLFSHISSRSASPFKQVFPQPMEEFLLVNVTRSPPGITDLSPFKIVTKVSGVLKQVLFITHARLYIHTYLRIQTHTCMHALTHTPVE